MVRLIDPSQDYLDSYMEAYDEYVAHGVHTYKFDDARAYDIFQKYHNFRSEMNLKPDRVGADYYWLVDVEKRYFIGEITIRHRLNEFLRRRGGHIGYGIRDSEWNKGYGSMMLKLALEKAKMLGLTKVLITCNDDNLASARVLEKNGFCLQDKIIFVRDGEPLLTRRYWKTL